MWEDLDNNPNDRDDALAESYLRLQLPLTRLAFLIVGSREIAEEIVQDAFADAAH